MNAQWKIITTSVIPGTRHLLMSFPADTGVHLHSYSRASLEDTSTGPQNVGFCLMAGMFWFCLIHSCQKHWHLTLTKPLRFFFQHMYTLPQTWGKIKQQNKIHMQHAKLIKYYWSCGQVVYIRGFQTDTKMLLWTQKPVALTFIKSLY